MERAATDYFVGDEAKPALNLVEPRTAGRCEMEVEAMTFGLPVIISNNVDIHDEIAKAGAGLIVSPTVEELCAAIWVLSNDPLLRFEMGQRAKALVQRKFCGHINARETLRVYRDVIQDSRESSAWKDWPKPLAV